MNNKTDKFTSLRLDQLGIVETNRHVQVKNIIGRCKKIKLLQQIG